jgi:hypothetical protein
MSQLRGGARRGRAALVRRRLPAALTLVVLAAAAALAACSSSPERKVLSEAQLEKKRTTAKGRGCWRDRCSGHRCAAVRALRVTARVGVDQPTCTIEEVSNRPMLAGPAILDRLRASRYARSALGATH